MEAPSDGLTDLERMQAKANSISDASLESSRRMRDMLIETQDTGQNTLAMLDTQGEQLNRVEANLDTINSEMKEADKALTGMEKWCGLFVCPWNKKAPLSDPNSGEWEKSRDPTRVSVVGKQPGGAKDTRVAPSGPYIQRITNDSREDEMEENLAGLGSILGNLSNMAVSMGSEIEKQNSQLDNIQGKTASADIRIDSANKRTEKLLK